MRRYVVLACVFWLSAVASQAQQLYTLETENLRIVYYSKAHEFIVPHLARCFENAFRFHCELFKYKPQERVTVMLQDFGDYGQGGAAAVPRNYIFIGIAPFRYVYETAPANERMNWLMNHELVHIVALDQSSSGDNFWRGLFSGKVHASKENPLSMFYSFLTNPREYTPRWYHEGIATFLETWMSGGLGRALGSYDEMVFRTMVRDSAFIYDAIGLESEGKTVDFQGGANSYLYGTRFMSHLAYQYGPERLLQWIARTDESKPYYTSQFHLVFGRSLDDEWEEWIAWERSWQQQNLQNLRQYPITPVRFLSANAVGSVSRSYYDAATHSIYAAISFPGQIAHAASIDVHTGKITALGDVKGAALYYVSSVAYDSSSGQLFYTTDNNKWRDLDVINVRTGEPAALQKDFRTGDLAMNVQDKSLWGVRHFNGISTIVRIPPPYDDWNTMYVWPYGKDVYDLDISPDGQWLTAALADVDGSQRLIRMETAKMLKGKGEHEVLYDFENSAPANFTFTPDGRYLFGTTYYTGASNIVRYDFNLRKMEWLTNTETGLFRPIYYSADSLIAFEYTGQGFRPVMLAITPLEDVSAIDFLGQEIVERYPMVESWKLSPPSPATVNVDSLTTYAGEYHVGKNVDLTALYPVVEGYKNVVAYGLRAEFSDPIFLTNADITVGYSPYAFLRMKERLHAAVNIKYWQWNLSATWNKADFYDLFGPTKRSRKGYSVSLQYRSHLIFDDPKMMDYSITLARHGNLERLPDFQNVRVIFDNFYSLNARLNYHFTLRSIGAVDEEKGIRWQFLSYNNYVNRTLYARVLTNADVGILLPLHHSSIWVRTSVGYSFGERREPLSNFYFGGYGNNWVDFREARRYREFESFPGVTINNISGTNFGKALIEWTLPPVRFRRLGFSTLYCNWSQLTLFGGGITTNIDDANLQRKVFTVGAQLDFKLVLFSTLESTLSIGHARAREYRAATSNETMISLKLLR